MRWATSYTMGQLAISEICNHCPLQQTLKVISCINFRGGLTACLNKSHNMNIALQHRGAQIDVFSKCQYVVYATSQQYNYIMKSLLS